MQSQPDIEHMLWCYCRHALDKAVNEAGHPYRVYAVKDYPQDYNRPSLYDARIRLELLHTSNRDHDLTAFLGSPYGRMLSIQAVYFPEDVSMDSAGALWFDDMAVGHIMDPDAADPTELSQGKIQEVMLVRWLWQNQDQFEKDFAEILATVKTFKA